MAGNPLLIMFVVNIEIARVQAHLQDNSGAISLRHQRQGCVTFALPSTITRPKEVRSSHIGDRAGKRLGTVRSGALALSCSVALSEYYELSY